MNNALIEIEAEGLPINWEVVRIGWSGPGNLGRQLTIEEVKSFAEKRILEAVDDELEFVSELTVTRRDEMISQALERLAPDITGDAERIWRFYLLLRLLDGISESPVEGLTELTTFWSSFAFPNDSPHVVQGRNNEITPQEYYTKEIFEMLVQKHRDWLNKEKKALQTAI